LVGLLGIVWLKHSPQTTGSVKIKVPKKVQAVIGGEVRHNDCATTQYAGLVSRKICDRWSFLGFCPLTHPEPAGRQFGH
jgi:hypothetical protein